MRTPIDTVLFFIEQIMSTLSEEEFDPNTSIQLSQNLCRLIVSQLELLQSFVADLLDLRQLRIGVFSFTEQPFDVLNVIMNIYSIFAPLI